MGDYLGIPRKYYDRMHQENIDLLAHNVNTWLHQGPEQRMIRTIDDRARAFLSSRYRLICSNGMTVNDARTRRNHVGRVNISDENLLIYSEATLKADDKAFILKVQDTVRTAVDEARFARILGRLRESTEKKLNTADIPGVVKLAAASLHLTEAEGDGVFKHLIQDADYTLYGLANAVTRYSQNVADYDRASKLEELGYQVITMSPELFRQINQVQAALQQLHQYDYMVRAGLFL